MKLASLLIPAYMPAPHSAATPTPYQSGVVDRFEKALVALSPFVMRHATATMLVADPAGRFVAQKIVTRYDLLVNPETPTLGNTIALALKSFNLPKITVMYDDADATDLTMAEAEELQGGLHPWNDQ